MKTTLRITVLCALFVAAGLYFVGCAHSPKAGAVRQSITLAIADAGAVAQEAEKEYTIGKIPQTSTARSAINALVEAYNLAKEAYAVVLTAESVYQGAQSLQIAACTPNATPAPGAPTCLNATKNATGAKVQLDTDQAALSTAISAMVSRTGDVKNLTAK